MGFADRRCNVKRGYSTSLVIPAKLKVGKESTLAGGRLILLDPRGEIDENDLLDFYETYVAPQFWIWLKSKDKKEAKTE